MSTNAAQPHGEREMAEQSKTATEAMLAEAEAGLATVMTARASMDKWAWKAIREQQLPRGFDIFLRTPREEPSAKPSWVEFVVVRQCDGFARSFEMHYGGIIGSTDALSAINSMPAPAYSEKV